MKSITVFLSCLIGLCPADHEKTMSTEELADLKTRAGQASAQYVSKGLAANYLSAQFAQRHHDWGNAGTYMENVLAYEDTDLSLLSKAMVLEMGSGDHGQAISLAQRIVAQEQDNTLALLFLAIEAFQKQNYVQASGHIASMPAGSLSEFILPLLDSWAHAADGKNTTQNLSLNPLHLYHSVLIADYLGQTEKIEGLLEQIVLFQEISLQDLDRIADAYAYIGNAESARALYEKLVQEWPENRLIAQKLQKLEAGEAIEGFRKIKTPEQGVALALYDMAKLLYQEYSDESSRVFSHLALYLDPDLSDAYLLLGYVTARNERYDEAISYYQKIHPDNDQYMQARRMAADMLEDAGRIEAALTELETLYDESGNLEALIQIGDVHRRDENFEQAVKTYNKAVDILGGKITEEYWQLHYVRGMSYERLGEWDKAEKDLKAALEYQPDHPLILNYLGYSWADQGKNLDESLELIKKAVSLQPTDGYITDSLGWVLFRMGRVHEALPHLERAVELLPYDPVINDHLGDAYWAVGRELEARFQWIRAKNHTKDDKLIETIRVKLESGPSNDVMLKEARTQDEQSESVNSR